MRNLDTNKEITWCPGCGDFGILNAIKKAVYELAEDGLNPDEIAITCGIGCHGKIFDYINLNGFYSLHGRAMATAEGIKLANPELKVIVFGGDGDSLGEGLEHTLFAAKRNMDITLILHNNGTYGLTTGQFAPSSEYGYKGPSTPYGAVENPFHAATLLMEAGASFVARTFSARMQHMSLMMKQAITHKGFSLLEILQPCVSFNNTYDYYNQRVYELDALPESRTDAFRIARELDRIALGVLHQEIRPVYHERFYQMCNPRTQRLQSTDRNELLKTYFSV